MINEATISELKDALRAEIYSALKQADPGILSQESKRVCQTVSTQAVWCNAKTILFFAPMQDEVNVWPLLEAALLKGANACLPRYLPQKDIYEAARIRNLEYDLVKGKFGIREPRATCTALPLNRLDFILVPGVAFNASGYRLGRGRGYYDRMLPSIQGIRCGVAYEQQIRAEIPVDPHDIHVDYVATPQRWIVASPHGAT